MLGSAVRLFILTLRSTNVFFCLLYSVLIYEWACRGRLYAAIYDAAKRSAPILGFLPSLSSKLALAAGFFRDAECALVLAFGIWMACAAIDLIPASSGVALRRAFKNVIVFGSLFCISWVFCLRYSLITILHTGLTRSLVVYAIQGSKPGWYLSFVRPTDVFFLALIFLAYYVHSRSPDRLRVCLRLIVILGTTLSFVLIVLARREANQTWAAISALQTSRPLTLFVRPEISGNPLGWVVRNAILVPTGNFEERPTRLPMLEQRRTVGFVDTAFALSSSIERPSSGLRSQPWDVVFFLLESISSKYATGSPDQRSIMPFTNELASRGLVLENHFSGGIDTDYATFPIFTALYPIPAAINFVTRGDLRFPTLFNILGSRYHNTFVSETDATVFYPSHLLLNSGLTELWDASNLPTQKHRFYVVPVSEPWETAAFFAKRLNSLPEPFVAVYNLYATHMPYFDYDPENIRGQAGGPKDRYKKNVALVDDQIKLIYGELEASGRAARTLVVITSDHGEAFGEHADDFGHGLNMFNEATHVPMMFYQPRLLKPARISDVTSHVDIVPTILDLIGVGYDPLGFQGESVIRTLRRKYVFMYGPKRDVIASVSRSHVKVIVNLSAASCSAYDLRTDPNELRSANCAVYPQQVNDLLEYRNHQLHFLPNYAASCHEAWPCAAIAPY
jgi:hypothetical protein